MSCTHPQVRTYRGIPAVHKCLICKQRVVRAWVLEQLEDVELPEMPPAPEPVTVPNRCDGCGMVIPIVQGAFCEACAPKVEEAWAEADRRSAEAWELWIDRLTSPKK